MLHQTRASQTNPAQRQLQDIIDLSGYSYADVARIINVSERTVKYLAYGRVENPRAKTRHKLTCLHNLLRSL